MLQSQQDIGKLKKKLNKSKNLIKERKLSDWRCKVEKALRVRFPKIATANSSIETWLCMQKES